MHPRWFARRISEPSTVELRMLGVAPRHGGKPSDLSQLTMDNTKKKKQPLCGLYSSELKFFFFLKYFLLVQHIQDENSQPYFWKSVGLFVLKQPLFGPRIYTKIVWFGPWWFGLDLGDLDLGDCGILRKIPRFESRTPQTLPKAGV